MDGSPLADVLYVTEKVEKKCGRENTISDLLHITKKLNHER
jgi:hypothetical protein